MATLFLFAGLPGTGKTTLSQQLAQNTKGAYLRIDTIEQGLRDVCNMRVEGEGYRLSYGIAEDNLRLGLDIVVDSCNPLELTRREWERVAGQAGAEFVNIEVICSDTHEHRHRIESRISEVPNLKLPTWEEVKKRVYQSWSTDRIVIDTAGRTESQCLDLLVAALGGSTSGPDESTDRA